MINTRIGLFQKEKHNGTSSSETKTTTTKTTTATPNNAGKDAAQNQKTEQSWKFVNLKINQSK